MIETESKYKNKNKNKNTNILNQNGATNNYKDLQLFDKNIVI